MNDNIKLIKEYMDGSPLNQAFVISAITQYAKGILKDPDQVREQMGNHIIHADAWIGCAEDWSKQMTKGW